MKEEKIYNYFYIVNNLKNGHFYLGVHSTDKLADGYMGSGLALKKAIKSYGKENFELTPLKFFKTRKELMAYEREVVNDRFLEYYKGICYNLKKGGEGGCEKRFSDDERKEHKKEYDRVHYQQNKEQAREYARVHYQQNKEYMREYDRRPERKDYHRVHYLKKKAEKQAAQRAII